MPGTRPACMEGAKWNLLQSRKHVQDHLTAVVATQAMFLWGVYIYTWGPKHPFMNSRGQA